MIAFVVVLIKGCRDNSTGISEVEESVLEIDSVNPSEGKFGTEITISGHGFSETASDNKITFNEKTTEILSSTTTTLKAIVPKGAGSGPIRIRVGEHITKSPSFNYLPTINVTTFAGSGNIGFRDGTSNQVRFNYPVGLEITENGELIVVDHWNHSIRIISPDGDVSTLAGNGQEGYSDGSGPRARFFRPTDVEIADDGSLYIADFGNHRIRYITTSGRVTTFSGTVRGYRDGHPTVARFSYPAGIALENDTLFVSGSGNDRVRWVTSTGEVGTYAGSGEHGFANGYGQEAEFSFPFGMDFANDGRIFLADYGNNSIRLISTEPFVSTFSGNGEAGYNNEKGNVRFDSPYDVAVDKDNMIYVADFDNHRIRRISPDREVTNIAGTGKPGLVNGDETVAQFNNPIGLAVNEEGTVLYVADHANHVIRKVTIE